MRRLVLDQFQNARTKRKLEDHYDVERVHMVITHTLHFLRETWMSGKDDSESLKQLIIPL